MNLEKMKLKTANTYGEVLSSLSDEDRERLFRAFNSKVKRYLDSETAVFSKEELESIERALKEIRETYGRTGKLDLSPLEKIKVDESLIFKGKDEVKSYPLDNSFRSWKFDLTVDDLIDEELDRIGYEKKVVPVLNEVVSLLKDYSVSGKEEFLSKAIYKLTKLEAEVLDDSTYSLPLSKLGKSAFRSVDKTIENLERLKDREYLRSYVKENYTNLLNYMLEEIKKEELGEVLDGIKRWATLNGILYVKKDSWKDGLVKSFRPKSFSSEVEEYVGQITEISYDVDGNTVVVKGTDGTISLTPLADLDKKILYKALASRVGELDYLPILDSFGAKTFEVFMDEKEALKLFSKEELIALAMDLVSENDRKLFLLERKALQFKQEKLEELERSSPSVDSDKGLGL